VDLFTEGKSFEAYCIQRQHFSLKKSETHVAGSWEVTPDKCDYMIILLPNSFSGVCFWPLSQAGY